MGVILRGVRDGSLENKFPLTYGFPAYPSQPGEEPRCLGGVGGSGPMTWRAVVSNQGEYISPLRIGLWDPFQMAELYGL